MLDDWVIPVDDIEGAVRTKLQIYRTEIWIGGLQKWCDFIRFEPAPRISYGMLFHPLEADKGVKQHVPLRIFWESSTGDDFNSTGFGLSGSGQKILHAPMLLGIIDSYGKRRGKIIHPRGNVRHQMGTIPHKDIAPRVGVGIRDVGL